MTCPRGDFREAAAREEWEKWWSALSEEDRDAYHAVGIHGFMRNQWHAPKRNFVTESFGSSDDHHTVDDGLVRGGNFDICLEESPAEILLEKERHDPDADGMGAAAAGFMSWLFRAGEDHPISSEDLMRRIFLVVRFGVPDLIERWEERLVRLLCQPGENFRLARLSLFDSRIEKNFRVNLSRSANRKVSLSIISRLGLGACLEDFWEVEQMLRFWFSGSKINRPPVPSWVVRRALNTAYAIRPDLVQGYSQRMLAALTNQTRATFSKRGLLIFDQLGIHQALGWSREARAAQSELKIDFSKAEEDCLEDIA